MDNLAVLVVDLCPESELRRQRPEANNQLDESSAVSGALVLSPGELLHPARYLIHQIYNDTISPPINNTSI